MTEELKYKAGDKVLIPFEILEVNEGDSLPYTTKRLDRDNTKGYWTKVTLESIAINTPPKHQVPQVAFEYYEFYKGKLTGFDEWFGDFFDLEFQKEFGEDRAEELAKWFYDNDIQTNLERELALATLIVKGPEAVEVIPEKRHRIKLKVTGESLVRAVVNDGTNVYTEYEFSKSMTATLFTKQELIEAGFGDVFENPMFEVEEVE